MEDVLLEGAAGLVHREGGEPLHLGAGRDDRHPGAALVAHGLRRGLRHRDRVGVVGQHDHLRGARVADRLEDLAGRGAPSGAGRYDGRAGLREQLLEPRARGDHDHLAAGARRRQVPATALDLLGEVGDPDPVRATGLDPGLHRGADVVDVDVDVPQAVAADHDERVAERGQRPAQPRDRLVVGVEEVHHLVGRALRGQVAGRQRDRDRPRAERCGAADRALAGDRGLRGVEDHAQAAAAGVDHAGVLEDLELLGGAVQRVAGRARGGPDHVTEPVVRDRRRPGRRLAGRLGDGQDGALDGLADRGVAGLGRPRQPLGEHQGRPVVGAGLADPLQQGAHELGEDHAGVAARAEQGAAGEPGERDPEVPVGVALDPLQHQVAGRLEGEEQVRAGVPVGDRVHVERVDLLAGRAQGGERDLGEPEYGLEVEGGDGVVVHVRGSPPSPVLCSCRVVPCLVRARVRRPVVPEAPSPRGAVSG